MHFLKLLGQTFIDVFSILRSPRSGIRRFYGVSLYRNAGYLMAANVALASTGFFFWIAAARLYDSEAVGLASAAIAAMNLLALLSTVGLDFSLIRFVPNAGERSRDIINSSFTIGSLISIAAALIYVAGLHLWSPALNVIRDQPAFLVLFLASVVASTMKRLLDRTFIAKRRSGFTTAYGLIFALLRFVPLFIMAAFFESFGIVASWGITLMLAIVIGILLLLPKAEPGYRPFPFVKRIFTREMAHFSVTNYLSDVFWMLPQFIFPLMVINRLGAEENAYFFAGWAIGSILYMIPMAISFSLFAEGSYNERKLQRDTVRSLKLTIIAIIPAILILVLVGNKLLLIFGQSYSENATRLLQVLAISALPMSINYIYFGTKRVMNQMRNVVMLSLLMTIIALVAGQSLISPLGIVGIGVAWLIAQSVITPISVRGILSMNKALI